MRKTTNLPRRKRIRHLTKTRNRCSAMGTNEKKKTKMKINRTNFPRYYHRKCAVTDWIENSFLIVVVFFLHIHTSMLNAETIFFFWILFFMRITFAISLFNFAFVWLRNEDWLYRTEFRNKSPQLFYSNDFH